MRIAQKLNFGGRMTVDGSKLYFTHKVWGLRIVDIIDPVRLGLRWVGNEFEVFWPSGSKLYYLLETDSLTMQPTVFWEEGPIPTLIDGEWRVRMSGNSAQRFFRLYAE
jgi:hypothetical protein